MIYKSGIMYCDKDLIYQGMEKKMMNIVTSDSTKKIMKIIGHFASIVFITAFLHWTLVNFYSHNCVDSSWKGIFTNMINLGSPFCQFINYIQFEISKYYVTIWASAGIGLIAYFVGKE
tara:strand:+ start:718 stop:1071 length:354 start_codon:yes stop_codon:yes gene_type:complete